MRDGRAAIFVTRLDVMLSVLPGNVVNIVPVGIDAIPRVAGAGSELRKRPDAEARKTQIDARGPGIEPDARWIKVPVLGVKTFGETIPTETRLVDDRWSCHRNKRNAHELHSRRRKRVVVWQRAAANKRQRKTLLAVTNEVAPRQRVVLVELVIHLDQPVVDVVGERRSEHRV